MSAAGRWSLVVGRWGLRRAVSIIAVAVCLAGAVGAAPPALVRSKPADLVAAVREPGARVVVVNVWATWCLPCREEMPALLRLRKAYADRGLRLVLVSGDFSSDAEQAAAYLGELGVDFPTYIKEGSDMELIDALDSKWSGALPATFIFDGNGRLRESIFGAATYEQFEAKIRPVMESSQKGGSS